MAINTVKTETTTEGVFQQHLVNDSVANNDLLLHEQQLDGLLGQSINNNQRADFSLMLAMLTEDVREHSQFFQPNSQQPQYLTQSETFNKTLRNSFELPNAQSLALENIEQIEIFNQAEMLESNEVTTMNLMDVLTPKPLAFRDNKYHIDYDVINNTSLFCQAKFTKLNALKLVCTDQNSETKTAANANTSVAIEQKLFNKKRVVNVQGWLNAIQTSIVKSTLITAA